jgi:hypothetical protein
MITEIREAINQYTMESSYIDESNFFWGQAPQGKTGTYIVASINSNPYNRDTGQQYEEYYINFSIFGKLLSEIETIENEIRILYSEIPTTFKTFLSTYGLSGWRIVSGASLKEDDEYWHNILIVQFEIYQLPGD